MSTLISGNSIQLGDSSDASENFVLKSNVDGTLTLARGNLGAIINDLLTIDENDVVNINGGLVVDGTRSDTGFRNKIIGGDFSLNPWQRGTSFAAAVAAAYSADRWVLAYSTSAVVTISKAVDAPTVAQAGVFTQHCLGVAVTTADASLAASDTCTLQQRIEGYNAASFGFGQAGTRYCTLSFWAKAAKTGIHCVAIRNSARDRSYVAEYTVAVADTWERHSITIPVDITGTWLYDSSEGACVSFALAGGTTFQTTAGSWAAGNFLTSANQVNELDTIGNNFKIALVQLEVGQNATAFEQRSIQQELELCRRYYQLSLGSASVVRFSGNVTTANSYNSCAMQFTPQMRASPTVALTNVGNNSFAAVSGTATADASGFLESRAANATGVGSYSSSWTATAEL